MKFTLLKDLRRDPLMRPVLTGFLLFLMLFITSDLAQKREQIGLHVSSASGVIYGDEESYIDPISTVSLLEILHSDLFMVMMTLLTLSAIYIRLSPYEKLTKILLHAVMLSAILSFILLLMAHYFQSIFLILWLISLWSWHILAFCMSVESLYRLYSS
ncbi:MAG: hypothetical protein U9R50_01750 [Campylobacterota bacterium]|nr:hypothetical protein [Campylobacterota bacterium]